MGAERDGAAADLSPRRLTLANGLRVLATPMPHTRSATVSCYVGAGARYEADELAGVSHLVEHCLFKGSAAYPTASQMSAAIEGVGGVINAATDRELTVYYAKAPATRIDEALDVITDLVCRPLFNAEELEKERKVILEELAAVEDSPGQVAGLLMDGLLWRDTPIGRDIAGTPASVSAIPHAETQAYWHRQYAPQNALISLAGAIDVEAAAERIAERTASWEYGEPQQPSAAPMNAAGPRAALRRKEAEQSHIVLGLPSVGMMHEDRYALTLLTAILGDGMSSRLFVRVREQLGLVYDVHAFGTAFHDSGALQVYLGVDPENALEALTATLGELSRLRDGVEASELSRAREYVCGRMLMGLEDTRSVSAWNGGQELLRGEVLSVDTVTASYEAVTVSDIARVANEYIREDALRLSVVGPTSDLSPFEEALRL